MTDFTKAIDFADFKRAVRRQMKAADAGICDAIESCLRRPRWAGVQLGTIEAVGASLDDERTMRAGL